MKFKNVAEYTIRTTAIGGLLVVEPGQEVELPDHWADLPKQIGLPLKPVGPVVPVPVKPAPVQTASAPKSDEHQEAPQVDIPPPPRERDPEHVGLLDADEISRKRQQLAEARARQKGQR